MSLPPPSALPALPDADKLAALDLLFEPAPALHDLALPWLSEAPASYAALVGRVRAALLALAGSAQPADLRALDGVLGAHPRLGAAKVDSALSRAEQATMAQGGAADEAAQLAALNAEYEARYPGLRYVVFVNGRPRADIMRDMRSRIDGGSLEGERRLAIHAMCDIANDRAGKLLPPPA